MPYKHYPSSKLFCPNNSFLAYLIYSGSKIDMDIAEFYSLSILWGILDDIIGKKLTNFYDKNRKSYKFIGKINMEGAFSLSQEDKFRSISHTMLPSEYLIADYANCVRCDIWMSNRYYTIGHITYDDHSSTN